MIRHTHRLEGYQQTEAGLIPEDWKVVKLIELCLLQRGIDITESIRIEGDVPVYSSSGLSYYHNQAKAKPPGVITGRKGILGKVFYIEVPYWPHDTTLWVKNFNGNHPKYVYWLLQSLHLERFDAASAVPTLNRNNISGLLIPLPPLYEQQAIDTALSDANALITSLEQLISKKQNIKQGALQKLFSNSNWEVRKLGDLAHIRKGQLITEKDTIIGNIPVIAGGMKPSYYHNVANRKANTITISASGANAGYVLFHSKPIFASDCSTIEESNSYDVKYLFFLLQLRQQEIFQLQTGGAQPHIYPEQLRNLEVGLPPTIKEQEAIAQTLSDMDIEIKALEQKLKKYKLLRKGMMQNLLTGKIRLV